MNPAKYDARGMLPDADRLADAPHVKRDPVTDKISWPPSKMLDVLRELKLMEDHDSDT